MHLASAVYVCVVFFLNLIAYRCESLNVKQEKLAIAALCKGVAQCDFSLRITIVRE